MIPQPDDHTLNKVLAKWAGVEIHWVEKQQSWFICNKAESVKFHPIKVWHPLTDANQMELVEAGLKQKGIEFVITSAHLCNLMIVELILANGVFEGKDPDKKRAFALAVAQLGGAT